MHFFKPDLLTHKPANPLSLSSVPDQACTFLLNSLIDRGTPSSAYRLHDILVLMHFFVMYRSCEKEVMTLEFFCAENRVTDWTNHWKRQRLVWWRKFANVRSNFSVYDKQADLEPGLHNQTFIQVNKDLFHGHAMQNNLHHLFLNDNENANSLLLNLISSTVIKMIVKIM